MSGIPAVLRRAELREALGRVRLELSPDLPLVPLDETLFEQVLLNLLNNALRQSAGAPVDLKAWRDGPEVRIEVADRGPGIPLEWRERIFEKFTRLPGGSQSGLGLGLAISRAIVSAHGSRIWVESRPGGGASFRIALPMGENPPEQPLPEEAAF